VLLSPPKSWRTLLRLIEHGRCDVARDVSTVIVGGARRRVGDVVSQLQLSVAPRSFLPASVLVTGR
jgi:hypothetical protein